MAQNDYIADIGKSEVTFKGTPIARFDSDTKEVTEYLADGANRKRWVAAAIKAAPCYDPEQQFDYDAEGSWETIEAILNYEEDFYKHFPAAPRPYNNPVGHLHNEVFDWVNKNFPKIVTHLYPYGPWNPEVAGLKGNRTIRPEKDIELEYIN